jgi:hypothetical protein
MHNTAIVLLEINGDFMRVQVLLLCAALLISSQAFAETRAVKRSFSGGSASADSIALYGSKKSDMTNSDTARAMPRTDALKASSDSRAKSSVRTVKRSMSGGSGMADEIRIGTSK